MVDRSDEVSQSQRFEIAADAAGLGVWQWDLLTNQFQYSARAKEIYGFPADSEVTYEHVASATHPDDLDRTNALAARSFDPEIRAKESYRYRIILPTGEVRWLIAYGHATFGEVDGRIKALSYIGTLQDITEQNRAEAALIESEARLQLAVEAGHLAVWELDVATNRITPSAALNRLYGFAPDATPTVDEFRALYAPGEVERLEQLGAEVMAGGEGHIEAEIKHLWPDGTVRWFLVRAETATPAGVSGPRVIGVVIDVTESKRTAVELERSERRLRMSQEAAGIASLEMDIPTGIVMGSEMFWRIWGLSPRESVHISTLENIVVPEHSEVRSTPETRRTGTAAPKVEYRIKRPDTGEERWLSRQIEFINDEQGRPAKMFGVMQDITEQKRAAEAAVASEARFRSLAQSMPNHVWTALPDGNLDWFNDQVYAFSGAGPGELDGQKWTGIVHPEDIASAAAAWGAALATVNPYQTEFRLRRHDGAYRWHIARAVAIVGPAGAVERWVGSNTDIEDQKRAEAELASLNATLEARVEARTAELRHTEEVLRQSQKMEAIGNLSGGIAHDFNNLLQVISGNLQLLAKSVANDDAARNRVENALTAVSRGASLSRQLLAFGRRQPLAPKVTNLGRLIRGMDDLLRRALGEGVEIETLVSGGLWNTMVDQANLESALLNLAINGRDAMDGRGKLTIEAGNAFLDDAYVRSHHEVTPGQYVMIAVTDTGSGISPEVMQKVFEPFFTTKAEGKGTGLGLSMVYGFVKQSGGHIKIYSELGAGTTIRIYLPRSRQKEEADSEAPTVVLAGGREIILVAEDDDAVRDTTTALLTDLGYRVIATKDADAALKVIESGEPIDLLFTDVVMPGKLKSTELARLAREKLPRLGVLFTSGYTENSIVHGGRLDEGVHLLSKPYPIDALVLKIRQVLMAVAAAPPSLPAAAGDGEDQLPHGNGRPAGLKILVCEDEWLILTNTMDVLGELGHLAVEASNGRQAMQALQNQTFDVLLTDVGLPDMSGVELARQARLLAPELAIIFASGHSAIAGSETVAGAVFLTKPYQSTDVARALRTFAR